MGAPQDRGGRVLDIIPIAMPAILVVVAAALLIRRERADEVIDLTTAWDDVPVVSLDGFEPSSEHVSASGGALVEPDGTSLGARLRETAPPPTNARPRVRVRRRDQPLVAARLER
ncbi:hypothetical protein [Actinospongicola halichondriae]|uniref:hypothetical protein n=1 Tax=Actinospongicola halichondriae TaxID=3236844 RepID=UPI003D58C733